MRDSFFLYPANRPPFSDLQNEMQDHARESQIFDILILLRGGAGRF